VTGVTNSVGSLSESGPFELGVKRQSWAKLGSK
jgi:hypothetical protein